MKENQERLLYVMVRGPNVILLTREQAIEQMAHFRSFEWEHTATIDPAMWIQDLCESCDYEVKDAIAELKSPPRNSLPYHTVDSAGACDVCIHAEPHYCRFRGKPMKNMDVKTCSAWTAKESK